MVDAPPVPAAASMTRLATLTPSPDELAIADAELRHVVDRLVKAEDENTRLQAELDAAEAAVTDLVHDLEAAHAAGYVSSPSIWWSA